MWQLVLDVRLSRLSAGSGPSIMVKLRKILKAAGTFSVCHVAIFMGSHCLLFEFGSFLMAQWSRPWFIASPNFRRNEARLFLVDCTFSHAYVKEHCNWKPTGRKIFARRSAYRLAFFVIKYLCSQEEKRKLLCIITEPSCKTVRYRCVHVTQLCYLRPSIYNHVL
jgi:hypothetical protein